VRVVLAGGVLFFVALFFLTTFLPSPQAQAEAAQYFTLEDIERGLQYSLQRRLLFWAATALHLAFLTVVVFSGFARRLADAFHTGTGRRWLLTVLLVGAFCLLADELIALIFGLIRLEHLRAWGMTEQSVGSWLGDFTIALAVSAVFGAVVLGGLYVLLRRFPRHWWLPAGVLSGLLGIFIAFVLPILITPLFNTFTPLAETKWAPLQDQVERLAERAGLPVDEVLVMDASRQSYHSNAYFTGFGATRRIVLYDNLLKKHEPAEVESILAHEMGHWRHQHIAKGIALGTLGALVGFWLLSRILTATVGRPPFRLDRPSDPAGIPLVLLLVSVGGWLALPVQNAITRTFERQADVAALELAGQPKAFKEAEIRLARDNISNVAPNRLSVLWFATHPTVVERIRMAEEWQNKPPGR
jgi:STE24 endopeptidase